jgi:phage-related protein (TIGR01555 family)
MVAEAWKRSMQKTAADFKVEGPDGVAMDASNIQNSAKSIFAASGQNMPDSQLYWYASQGFIGYQLCAIIAQNWLVEKCCVLPGRDAVRTGYEIAMGDGVEVGTKVINAIKKADKKYRINRQMVEFVKFGRLFGIRVAMFVVDSTDPEYYEKPFNPDGVTPGSYRGINQIDPYWCSPILSTDAVSKPMSINFYEPTYWLIDGHRIHHSHLVIMRGAEVPDVLKPSYMYGGVSVPQRVFERVYAAERTANESPLLALSKRSRVLSTDLAKVAANPARMLQVLSERADRLNNFGTDVIDLKNDKVEHHDTTLSDMDSVIMTQYQLVAAAANIPATKLLGTQPKGFNSSGDYEADSYHEELESIQTHDLTPLLDGHHLRVWRSDIMPKFPGVTTKDMMVEHSWNPTASLTAEEQAAVNKTKAETGKILSESGAIDGIDERQRVTLDKDSGYSGLKTVQPEPDADGDPATRNPLAVPAPVAAPGLPVQDGYAMDMELDPWDATTGTLGGAQLVTNQQHLDPSKMAEKRAARDYAVQVTPAFVDLQGKEYRVVIDGHHSLSAAIADGVTPTFVECDYTGTDYRNAVTAQPV